MLELNNKLVILIPLKIENTIEYWEYSKFILKYPESKYFNLALKKYYQTRNEYYDSVGIPIVDCFRNCAALKIKSNNQILFEHDLINKEDLQDSLLNFFINEKYEDSKPEKKYIKDIYDRPQEISKGQVQLEYIHDSCTILQSVVKDIHSSLESYKNYLSKNWYKNEFVKLGELEKHQLDSLLEYRLVLFGCDKFIVPPPPPPRPHVHEVFWPDTVYLNDTGWEEFEKAINEE